MSSIINKLCKSNVKPKIDFIPTVSEIIYPNSSQFSESFNIVENVIYIPLNGEQPGLYLYTFDVNSIQNTPLFEWDGVIVGSKIKDNIFVGCNLIQNELGVISQIIKYNLTTKKQDILKCDFYVNDICFDDKDVNIVYTISNVNYKKNNGIVHKINLTTGEMIVILDKIDSGSGINCIDGLLYIATLFNVISFNLENGVHEIIIKSSQSNFPMFDNISIYNRELCIAIFDYNKSFFYRITRIKWIKKMIMNLFSFTLGVSYFNIHNTDRTLSGKTMQFAIFNLDTKKTIFYNINYAFDQTVTQIVKLNETTFILTNWKANKMLKITI